MLSFHKSPRNESLYTGHWVALARATSVLLTGGAGRPQHSTMGSWGLGSRVGVHATAASQASTVHGSLVWQHSPVATAHDSYCRLEWQGQGASGWVFPEALIPDMWRKVLLTLPLFSSLFQCQVGARALNTLSTEHAAQSPFDRDAPRTSHPQGPAQLFTF